MKITVEDFNKIEMRAGTVVHVEINKRARKPAYKVDIDFGNEIGIKSTSAQITDLYNEENLVGKQVICCVNLPARMCLTTALAKSRKWRYSLLTFLGNRL